MLTYLKSLFIASIIILKDLFSWKRNITKRDFIIHPTSKKIKISLNNTSKNRNFDKTVCWMRFNIKTGARFNYLIRMDQKA